ncbi:cation diffusion facilitator family transporter [Thermaerobacter marianensis DSM 12885]|uniref:Cation diffusion facilitator family transporter n=1 Tax=Thermaerobacter marianensis (strain ATCC 700841 / DSM 12885 / JCM 10246 / 7p75a) TaxID=644966 RepID=E6SGX7_THEM7|nr:cation diffusion facilitator family transporter [Thermaerobacter marianensis]ADU50608.1 cation diffusion facilitator family transporter [Thermaerobacter marianensis DSM 12885]
MAGGERNRAGGIGDDTAASLRGAWLSAGAYLLLSAVKIAVGWRAGSRGVLADGLNNLTDVLASAAVLWGIRAAARPADAEHRYGHGRAETVAQLVVGTVMGLVGLNVGVAALQAALAPQLEPPEPYAAAVALAAAAVMTAVYLYNRALARRTGSPALRAAARDHRSDALVSLGTVVGIWGARRGWPWLDPVAGLVVGLLVVRTAWRLLAEATHELLDGFEPERLHRLSGRVAAVEGVQDVREVRGRRLGKVAAIDVTITVDPDLTVEESHAVADRVEQALRRDPDIQHVHVHVEPHPAGRPGSTVPPGGPPAASAAGRRDGPAVARRDGAMAGPSHADEPDEPGRSRNPGPGETPAPM